MMRLLSKLLGKEYLPLTRTLTYLRLTILFWAFTYPINLHILITHADRSKFESTVQLYQWYGTVRCFRLAPWRRPSAINAVRVQLVLYAPPHIRARCS
jgi:hypothetical protein